MPTVARECWRIVHAVADHREPPVCSKQLLNCRNFVFGHHVRTDVVDAEALANGIGDSAVIAGEHHQRMDRKRAQVIEYPTRDRAWLVR
jgi:hypothetical protein